MELYLLDESHDLTQIATCDSLAESLTIAPNSVLLLSLHHQ